MAIKPKKQMPANKGETGGGAPRGGAGRDLGGRSGGASNLTNAIQKRSVKVVKPAPSEQRALENTASTFRTQARKSGLAAKIAEKTVKRGAPKATVKVNSAPARTADAAKAANAKALKAANKGKKK